MGSNLGPDKFSLTSGSLVSGLHCMSTKVLLNLTWLVNKLLI